MNTLMFGSDSIFPSNQTAESYSLELKQSAIKINKLIQACSNELHQAEDVFNSKPKISAIAKQELFEQLSLISGCDVRIRHVGERCKAQAIEQMNKSWEERVEKLRIKWFIDAKQQPKKGIGWGEKNSFIKELPNEIKSLSQELSQILKEKLSIAYKEFLLVNLEAIRYYIDFSIQEIRIKLNKILNLTVDKIETKFCNSSEDSSNTIKYFTDAVSPAVEALVNKGWGDISWEEVVKFKNEVSSQIEQIVTSIFDNRVKVVTQAAERVMSFYNNFLERQERYRQETPEQRKAEKAWIDQQRQKLARVQDAIKVILNAS